MADHSTTKILGVGKKTSEALAEHNILTVGQLADLESGQLPIHNLSSLISRAKTYIQNVESTTLDSQEPKSGIVNITPPLFFSSFTTKLATPNQPVASLLKAPNVKEEDAGTELAYAEEKYMVTDHSWWEMKILLPRADKSNTDRPAMQEAIIYELSIEPHNRISFVCSWVITVESEHREKLCSMTYSPSFIFFFNLSLPPLEVSMRQEDLDKLDNKHVLTNVLTETNTMIQFKLQDS